MDYYKLYTIETQFCEKEILLFFLCASISM
jgi:hypothetical protein